MDMWWDFAEVGVVAQACSKGFPHGPVGVFVGGSFRSDSRAGLVICNAEISEESITGLRGTICQDWDWGYLELK